MNWRRFLDRESADSEQGEELESYLELTAQEYIERGMEPSAARNAARRKLGNTALIREEVYRMNTVTILDGLARGSRQALRLFRLNPGYCAAAVLSLAIGTGCISAMFSVVHAVLIRPLAYPDSESLVGVFNSGSIQGETFRDMGLAPGMYWAVAEGSGAFEAFGVWSSAEATVTGNGDPEQIKTVAITHALLPALGAQPLAGRLFSAEDDAPGTLQTVVIAHSYWMKRFGGDPRVIGRSLEVNSIPRQVIGVLPSSFRFLDLAPDVFLPQRLSKSNRSFEPFTYSGIARLKPGITLELANQDVERVLYQAMPENLRRFARQARLKPNLRPLKRDVTGDIGSVLSVLMGALCLVFLLVCANVANLLLVRSQGRAQEFAIRSALGAGSGRIARELLVESMTLALAGCMCGLAIAYGVVRILKAQQLAAIPRLAEISIDATTVAFSLACALTGAFLFGLIAVFKCGLGGKILQTRGSSLGFEQMRAQNVLVVAQVALALMLLVASGLLIRSFFSLRGVHPGFTGPERIQTVRVAIPASQVPDAERVARMQAEILERVSRLPGVEMAAFADGLPMEAVYHNGNLIAVEDKFSPGQMPPNRNVKYVSPGLFATLGTRLLAGRDFDWRDVEGRRAVAIVSEGMARENWGAPRQALGKRLRPGALGNDWFEVVGVVEDVRDDGAHRPAPATVYFRTGVYDPSRPGRPASVRRGLTLAIRTSRTGSEGFLAEVSAALHAVDASLPLAQVGTLAEVYRRSMARTEFTAVLLIIAGALALLLSLIGVHGVLAHAVLQRRREISIRIALGANPAGVVGLFLRRGIALAAAGCAAGLIAALGLSRWVSSILYGVTALDPATYAAAVFVIASAALIASSIPACRAAFVDPAESLRAD
ncbi:MAG: ABC transporter permease [Bryobacteraceae bacterium]